MNMRFVGPWLLEGHELNTPDGSISRPWGDDPHGIIWFDADGRYSVQVGPRDPARAAEYVAFYGTAEAPEGEAGTLVLHVEGSSAPSRLTEDQVRGFTFITRDLLELRPPQRANGDQPVFRWRRSAGGGS